MRYLMIVIILLVASTTLAAAKKEKRVDFLGNAQFEYGMAQSEADSRFGDPQKPDEDWNVIYRVDTPSTTEFGCTYKTRELYLVRFYQGECFYIERRTEILFDEVQEVFNHFNQLYGNTPESTQSRDGRLLYARWMLKDRDIELSAHQREGNIYIMTHEEFDPMLLGEALRAQERELENAGTREIDPLTGKPRFSTHQPTPETDDDTTDPEDSGDEDSEDTEDDEEKQDPPPEEDEPDWY